MIHTIILFIEKEFNHILDAADLTDRGTKVFGDYVLVKAGKKGNVKKLIQGRIVAAYCDGEVAIKEGIKSLSDGQHFISVDDFKSKCEALL